MLEVWWVGRQLLYNHNYMSLGITISELNPIQNLDISNDDFFPIENPITYDRYKVGLTEYAEKIRGLNSPISASVVYCETLHSDDFDFENLTAGITAFNYIISGSKVATPEMYGAKGDGTTDDTDAINTALVNNNVVKLSNKTYAVRGGIFVSGKILIGGGKRETTIKVMDNSPNGLADVLTVMTLSQALIKDFTIDCNFEKQARHETITASVIYYNYQQYSGSRFYIPELKWKIRSNSSAIASSGGGNIIDGIRIINYGCGTQRTSYPDTQYNLDDSNTFPTYIEGFLVGLVSGLGASVTPSSSVQYPSGKPVGFSNLVENYFINSEISQMANADLWNYWSNVTLTYVQAGAMSVSPYGISNIPRLEGGMINCYIDPGEDRIGYTPPTGSLWNGLYLDERISSSISASLQTGSVYNGLWKILTGSLGPTIGNDGDFAVLYYNLGSRGEGTMKKISGSWHPHTRWSLAGQWLSSNVIVNSTIKNITAGNYFDSWRSNILLYNNTYENVMNGQSTLIGNDNSYWTTGITNYVMEQDYYNFIFKNNHYRYTPHRYRIFTMTSYGIYYPAASITVNLSDRNIKNLIIENNVFEIPSSSYYSNTGLTQTDNKNNPRMYGISFTTNYQSNNRSASLVKNLTIKNNTFLNFNSYTANSVKSSAWVEDSLSPPIYFSYLTTASVESTVENFERNHLPNYQISNNIVLNQFDGTYMSKNKVYEAGITTMNYPRYDLGNYYYYSGLGQQHKKSEIRPTNFELYVAGTLKPDGLMLPKSSSLIIEMTGSTYIDGDKLRIYPGYVTTSEYIIDDVISGNATVNVSTPPVAYNLRALNNSYQFDIYAYKTVSGARAYSATPYSINVVDENNLKFFKWDITWAPVVDASGYIIVVVTDTYNGFLGNCYLDAGNVTFADYQALTPWLFTIPTVTPSTLVLNDPWPYIQLGG